MNKRDDFNKAAKFMLVGVFNTVISYLVFFVLFRGLNLVYFLASFFAYFAGLLNSYYWNLRWTFKEKHSGKIMSRFLLVNFIALSTKLLLMYLMVGILNINELTSELLAMILSIILNFLGNNFWTFR